MVARWFADVDPEATFRWSYRPYIQTKGGVVCSLDIWFEDEEECLEFVRNEIVGVGILDH